MRTPALLLVPALLLLGTGTAFADQKESRLIPRFGAGTAMGFGITPAPTLGGTADAGFRYGAFSIALEGRVDFPLTSVIVKGAHLSIYRYIAGLAPCGHVSIVFGCAVAQMGALPMDVVIGKYPIKFPSHWLSAGLRAGVEIPFTDHFGARLSAEILYTNEAGVELNEVPVWVASPVVGGINLSAFVGL